MAPLISLEENTDTMIIREWEIKARKKEGGENMIISRRRYNYLRKRIAELEQQVKIQQFTLEMCKKIDTSAMEITMEGQSIIKARKRKVWEHAGRNFQKRIC